jgi:hypothetical protein
MWKKLFDNYWLFLALLENRLRRFFRANVSFLLKNLRFFNKKDTFALIDFSRTTFERSEKQCIIL